VPPVVLESDIACPFVARIGARLVVVAGEVDEFLGAAVERSAFDQLEVEVGRTHEDRIRARLSRDDAEERDVDLSTKPAAMTARFIDRLACDWLPE
jgi:hypothetical protein